MVWCSQPRLRFQSRLRLTTDRCSAGLVQCLLLGPTRGALGPLRLKLLTLVATSPYRAHCRCNSPARPSQGRQRKRAQLPNLSRPHEGESASQFTHRLPEHLQWSRQLMCSVSPLCGHRPFRPCCRWAGSAFSRSRATPRPTMRISQEGILRGGAHHSCIKLLSCHPTGRSTGTSTATSTGLGRADRLARHGRPTCALGCARPRRSRSSTSATVGPSSISPRCPFPLRAWSCGAWPPRPPWRCCDAPRGLRSCRRDGPCGGSCCCSQSGLSAGCQHRPGPTSFGAWRRLGAGGATFSAHTWTRRSSAWEMMGLMNHDLSIATPTQAAQSWASTGQTTTCQGPSGGSPAHCPGRGLPLGMAGPAGGQLSPGPPRLLKAMRSRTQHSERQKQRRPARAREFLRPDTEWTHGQPRRVQQQEWPTLWRSKPSCSIRGLHQQLRPRWASAAVSWTTGRGTPLGHPCIPATPRGLDSLSRRHGTALSSQWKHPHRAEFPVPVWMPGVPDPVAIAP